MRNQFRQEPVPMRVKLAYGVTDLATALPLSTITFFLLFFYTDVIQLPAVLVGQAMLIAKIWDAISDPLMGQISDRTKSRWGRRRPYLLFGAIPYVIFFILLWTPGKGFNQTQTFLYLIILFILFFTSSTIIAGPP